MRRRFLQWGFKNSVRYQAGDNAAYGELIETSETSYTVKRLQGN